MKKNETLGIYLLVVCALTLLWSLISPRFMIRGESGMYVWKDVPNGQQLVEYYKMDLGKFLAGEIVIITAAFGVYLLRGGMTPNKSPEPTADGTGSSATRSTP
jgi:hypothetical protein